jgi:CRP/FNR family cyclic AMP-dependent transcriptional regulator
MERGDFERVPILSTLSDDDLGTLARIARERDFADGAVIFGEGGEDNSLFFILSGRVRITKQTSVGEDKQIALLSEGGFFGEMALFDDYLRSATATAAGPVRALQISKDAFMHFLSASASGASKLLLEIMRALAPRIRQTNLELVTLYETGRTIGKGGEVGELLSGLLEVLQSALSCERGAAFLINTASQTLECRAAFGYDADPSVWSEPLEGGIAGEVLQAEGSVIIESYQNQPHLQSIQPVGYETASMLAGPLLIRGEPIGMLVLCDKVDRNRRSIAFTSGDANILAGVAAQAAGAIDSARLHEEAREKEKLDRVYFRF